MLDHMSDFESLGSNCELGFILERAGVTTGGLFKWALIIDFADIIAALDGNFEGMYQTQNLTPYLRTMVRDAKYGLCWHTAMKITGPDDGLVFEESEEDRAATIASEKQKLDHLVGKFLDDLKARHKIYVMRSNSDIPADNVRTMLSRLRRRGKASILVIKQSTEQNRPGTVRHLEDGVYEGYVTYLSTSPALEDVQDEGWLETCRNAWDLIAPNSSAG